jgi:hypothetical protein
MTTNQLIAMAFPLITLAGAGLTGLLVLKIWGGKREEASVSDIAKAIYAEDASIALDQATKLIGQVQRQLHHQP